MTFALRNGRVLDPSQDLDEIADVIVRDGRIEAITPVGAHPSDHEESAEGLLITPGLIDIHVHLREPGFEYKEDIETGTAAAAAGGFTAVCCMPNTNPAIDSVSVVRHIIERAEAVGVARVYPIASLTRAMEGGQLAEIADMQAAGACAVSDDAFPVQNAETMRRGMEYCAQLGLTVMTHNEDQSLTKDGAMNEGRTATLMGLPGIPAIAEDIGAARNIIFARLTGCRLHLLHISTSGTALHLQRAKADGVPVTGETAPHYLVLDETACEGYNTNAKMNPPLRREADRTALIGALQDHTIDALATDHAPHAVYEKEREFDQAPFGILGLETAFAVGYTHLVQAGHIGLNDLIRLMSCAPASILGLPGGTLKPGAPADISVFDLTEHWTVRPELFRSKSRNTPFAGWDLSGRCRYTLVGGRRIDV